MNKMKKAFQKANTSAAVLAGIIAVVFAIAFYFTSFDVFFGKSPAMKPTVNPTTEQVQKISDSDKGYIKFDDIEMLDTTYYSTRNDVKNKVYFFTYTHDPDDNDVRYVILELNKEVAKEADSDGYIESYTGLFTVSHSDTNPELLRKVRAETGFEEDILMGVVLQEVSPSGVMGIAIFLLAGTLISLAICVLYIVGMFVPALQKGYRSLKKYGEPEEVAQQIDSELPERIRRTSMGTQNWVMVFHGTSGLSFYRYEDIAWCHAFEIRKGRSVTGRFLKIYIRGQKKPVQAVIASINDGTELMQNIALHHPGLDFSYNKDKANLWKRDQDQFLMQYNPDVQPVAPAPDAYQAYQQPPMGQPPVGQPPMDQQPPAQPYDPNKM